MRLFYTPSLQDNICTLPPDESKHCVKVLRMKAGDTLHLTDGNGTLCLAHIIAADSSQCTVAIDERTEHYGQRPFHLHLAIAPTKNTARIEWFIEKAIEIGIDEITPIICQHSERTTLKQERLDKIAQSAMMQSLKTYRTTINPPTPILSLIRNTASDPQLQRYICHCDGERKHLNELYTRRQPALILIGPEGDFSHEEIRAAINAQFKPVTLGNCRLRTETAALYATMAINFMNE